MDERDNRKVYIMFRLRGDDIDPEEITRNLRLTPTQAFRKGDNFKAGKEWHHRAYGIWMISTENSVDSQELMDHYKCLMEWISPVKDQLKNYQSQKGIHMTAAFWWEPVDGPVGFTFPSKEMLSLAEMCDDFDFYFA